MDIHCSTFRLLDSSSTAWSKRYCNNWQRDHWLTQVIIYCKAVSLIALFNNRKGKTTCSLNSWITSVCILIVCLCACNCFLELQILKGEKSRLHLNLRVYTVTIFWKKPARELCLWRARNQQDCIPYCRGSWMTGGNTVKKLILGRTAPVNSVLCKLVVCFANSYEGFLIRELGCQIKNILSDRSTMQKMWTIFLNGHLTQV